MHAYASARQAADELRVCSRSVQMNCLIEGSSHRVAVGQVFIMARNVKALSKYSLLFLQFSSSTL